MELSSVPVTLAHLKRHILRVASPAHAICLTGDIGIAKSTVVTEQMPLWLAERYGVSAEQIPVVSIRVSQHEAGDFTGLPFQVNGATYFAPPLNIPVREDYIEKLNGWLAQGGHKPFANFITAPMGILFLDEVNQGSRQTRDCVMELIGDKKICGRPLPDGWWVVAAMNGDHNVYDVDPMSPASLDRLKVFNLSITHEEWFDYMDALAQESKVHPSVALFLRKFPGKIDPTNDAVLSMRDKTSKIQTRRSWTRAATELASSERADYDLLGQAMRGVVDAKEDILVAISGHVGHAHANSFLKFVVEEYKSLNPIDILDHWTPETKALLQKSMKRDLGGTAGLADAVLVELKRRESEKEPITETHLRHLHNFLSTLPKEVASGFLSHTWKANAPVSYGDAMSRFAFHHLFFAIAAAPSVSARQAVMDKWNYGDQYSATSLEVMGAKRSLSKDEIKARDAEATHAMIAAGKKGGTQ